MANINLLPWREEQRKERKRQFFSMMVLSVILTVMVMFMINLSISKSKTDQDERNAYLTSEIQVLDNQIKQIEKLEQERADLEQRMKIIQDLQRSRPQVVHLFDELPRLLPEGLYITEIERKDTALTIKGRTESNPRVSSFMRNIESSPWVANAQLGAIVADKKSSTPASDFQLTAAQRLPKTDADSDTAATTGPTKAATGKGGKP